MKETSILIGGFGGQGVLLLGRLIAYSGMLDKKEVTCFPSYGAEMRGGTANCTVIISDELIGSPVVLNTDILIAMNEASLKRFEERVKRDGVIFYDISLIKEPPLRGDIVSIAIPATEIASSIIEKGNSSGSFTQVRATNMVILGAFISHSGIISPESAFKALERLIGQKGKERLSENIEAIKRGMDYIASKKG